MNSPKSTNLFYSSFVCTSVTNVERDENANASNTHARKPFRLARPIGSLKEANVEERGALLEVFLDKLRNFQENHQVCMTTCSRNFSRHFAAIVMLMSCAK